MSSCSSPNAFDSFEHCELGFTIGSCALQVAVLYRPPPSRKNKLTNAMFFDDFATFLQNHMYGSGDLVLLGDMNFHLDRPDEPLPKRFIDLLDSLSFKQHIQSATHCCGHILDTIITRDN